MSNSERDFEHALNFLNPSEDCKDNILEQLGDFVELCSMSDGDLTEFIRMNHHPFRIKNKLQHLREMYRDYILDPSTMEDSFVHVFDQDY